MQQNWPHLSDPARDAEVRRAEDDGSHSRVIRTVVNVTGVDLGRVVATRALVVLYRTEGEVDWSAISEVIGGTPPEILRRVDAMETSFGRLASA